MGIEKQMRNLAIVVNGASVVTCASNLAELVFETLPDDRRPNDRQPIDVRVATALNGTFVPKGERGSHALSDGDVVEILSARQGG